MFIVRSVATRTQYAIVRTDRFVENASAHCDRLVHNAAFARSRRRIGQIARIAAQLRSFTIVDERATCFTFVGCCEEDAEDVGA